MNWIVALWTASILSVGVATRVINVTSYVDGDMGSLRYEFTAQCGDSKPCDVIISMPTKEPHRITDGQIIVCEGQTVTIVSENPSTHAIIDGQNNVVEDRGGFLYMEGGEVTMVHLELTAFTGSTRGGVIAMRGQGAQTLALQGCIFRSNAAEWYGGAIYAYGADGDIPGSASLAVDNCLFENNTALYNGGAVHFNGLYGSVSAAFNASRWRGNRATHGGGIADLFGDLTANGCSFVGNVGASAGGAYYQYTAKGSPNASSVFLECVFHGNEAPVGTGEDLHFHTVAEAREANSALLCACEYEGVYANEAAVSILEDPASCGI